jgi:ribonucleoside-diphosphate reductase beta chain
MMAKRYYNPEANDILDEKIYSDGSSSSGFVDFNRPRYKWCSNIYDLMNANTWFPSEVNTINEKRNFLELTENEQNIYKLTFAQLSFNDSAQEEYLSDFRRLANNRLIKATLSLQIMQEVNHSKSYAVLLDAAGNSNEVFELYRYNDALNRKNQKIAEQFAKYIDGSSAKEMLLSAMASVNLEGIYFMLGFAYIYVLGDKVPGARDMIKLISRDEINTHLPLFANIFKTIKKENSNSIDSKTIDKVYEMMREAVDIELEYGEYLIDNYPVMGLNKALLKNTVYNYANERLARIDLEPIFPSVPDSYLQKLVKKHLELNSVKSNFFESTVTSYAKTSIDLDDF